MQYSFLDFISRLQSFILGHSALMENLVNLNMDY